MPETHLRVAAGGGDDEGVSAARKEEKQLNSLEDIGTAAALVCEYVCVCVCWMKAQRTSAVTGV